MTRGSFTTAGKMATARPDREGKRMLAGYFDVETYQAFKVLAVEQDVTCNLLLAEAVRLLLERHGKPVPPALARQLEPLQAQQPQQPDEYARSHELLRRAGCLEPRPE